MKDKKLFISIVSIFTIISFIIGVSYAYFSSNIIGNDLASSHNQTTGTLQLTYNGTSFLSMPNASPGDTTSTTFTVRNTGNLTVDSYEIYFSKLKNTFINDEMVYTLTCTSSNSNPCQDKEQSPVPTSEELALTQGTIAPNTTHTYTLTVIFLSKPDTNQNYNQGKELSFTMTINEVEMVPAVLIARQVHNSSELFWEHRENITEVTFESTINIPNGVTSWDVSANQDGSVMAYIIDDGLGTNTYKLYIQSNGILNANPNSSYLFRDFTKLTAINSLSNFSTSIVTDMTQMFEGCSGLTSLDLSNFTTSSVISMSSMFYGCSSLTSLDLSNFTTSSVVYMYYMFYGCSGLTSLDLSNFNTSSVTNMSGMFYNCSSLTSLDLSNFNTNSVLYISNMFSGCRSLTNLNLRNATFSSVTSYDYMFHDITSGINIIVKDNASKTFINARLSDASRTGNVTIYVP